MDQYTPAFNKPGFRCPSCGQPGQQAWTECLVRLSNGSLGSPGVWFARCFICGALSYWLGTERDGGSMIYPTVERSGPPPNVDMPEAVKALYEEASEVASISPRSASALLRLAMEAMLKELYPTEGNLNAMIGAAVRNGLPQQIQQTMDVLRFNGNRSVHEVHSDDTLETAATLFVLLNMVVERLVTLPKELDELYDGMPESIKGQIAKRDGGSNEAAPPSAD